MSEMIERAAREVEDEYCLIYGKRCSTENARRLVLRTIAAMREPTPEMTRAAADVDAVSDTRSTYGYALAIDDAVLTWYAMIDEARG